MHTKHGYCFYKTVIIGYNTCTIFHSFIDKLSLILQHSLLTIMYEFIGLQPPTKKQKQVQREKRNIIIITEMYVNMRSERLGMKRGHEENKMHCLTCHEDGEVDKSIKPKKCI